MSDARFPDASLPDASFPDASLPDASLPDAVPVVAAVVCRTGRYLLGRRPEHKRHGGLWEFPGGKMMEGESDLAAVDRELREELGLRAVSTGRVLWERRDPGSPFVIRFVESEVRGDPTPTEHMEVGWFTPEALAVMPLAPTDAAFVARLGAEDGPLARP